uniref:RING-type domain-containing protein n=1 Tax=Panagrellus redivivus TaxID=6233 RepID=A0A7E4UZN2_PANRE
MSGQKKRSVVLGTSSTSSASTPSQNTITLSKADADLVELSRCCICFETYSKVTRVPISMPCGHTFCKMCVYKVIRARAFHCCVCRVVSIVGFGDLHKNLALIQLLEKLKLLDDDVGTDPCPPAGAYCVGHVPDQVYANIDLESFDLHSHFYLGLIKGYLQYQIDSEVNYLSPEIAGLSDAIRQIDKASNLLKLTFSAMRDSSIASEDLDVETASVRNFVTSPFAGTLPEYDIDELYPGIDFDVMRHRMHPAAVGNDMREVHMAWVPVTNGDLTLFRVYDANDFAPESYSQSGRASIDTRSYRASDTTAPLDFRPGPFVSSSRILPPPRNAQYHANPPRHTHTRRNMPSRDPGYTPYYEPPSYYGPGHDWTSNWAHEPHHMYGEPLRNPPRRLSPVVRRHPENSFTPAARVQQIYQNRRMASPGIPLLEHERVANVRAANERAAMNNTATNNNNAASSSNQPSNPPNRHAPRFTRPLNR